MFLLYAAVFLTIVLFSRLPFAPELPDGASLGFYHPPSPPALARLQPVVFALLMYSETSAMEGAILLKVLPLILYRSRVLVMTHLFEYSLR